MRGLRNGWMGGFRDGVLMCRRRKEREGGERGRRERAEGEGKGGVWV